MIVVVAWADQRYLKTQVPRVEASQTMDVISMLTILHHAPACTLFVLLALATKGTPPINAHSPPEDASSLLKELEEASPQRRPLVARKLMLLGASGLRATRAARDTEEEPELKRTLTRIATRQLAHKIAPVLRERYATNLRFDGQYEDLEQEGPEVVSALLSLINDEALLPGEDRQTHADLRLASCQALADVGSEAALPALRKMYHDPLLFPMLTERIGILMAIFGDTYAVEQEISRLEGLVAQSEPLHPAYLGRNMQLSNLYYQIRDYAKAVACYDRILLFYDQNYRIARRSQQSLPPRVFAELKKEFALQYYNAACSQTLNGDLDRAKESLKKCIELDPSHFANLGQDGDFKKLRDSESYGEFLKELRKLLPRESL